MRIGLVPVGRALAGLAPVRRGFASGWRVLAGLAASLVPAGFVLVSFAVSLVLVSFAAVGCVVAPPDGGGPPSLPPSAASPSRPPGTSWPRQPPPAFSEEDEGGDGGGCNVPDCDPTTNPKPPAAACAGCLGAGDCDDGEGFTCLPGKPFGSCGCPEGTELGNDDAECAAVVNRNGARCPSGQLDRDGLCVCSDTTFMHDWGNGCVCDVNEMFADAAGRCQCNDPHAHLDVGAGGCVCDDGLTADYDAYLGVTRCVASCNDKLPCADPHAEEDAETHQCVCRPGFFLGHADDDEAALPRCLPDCDAARPCADIHAHRDAAHVCRCDDGYALDEDPALGTVVCVAAGATI